MEEGQKNLPQVVLWPPYTPWRVYTHDAHIMYTVLYFVFVLHEEWALVLCWSPG